MVTTATRETFLSEIAANTTIALPSLSFSLSAKYLKSFAEISKTSVAKTLTPLTSISLDKLLYEPYSPGCIFRLNSDELILHLEKVNVLTDEAISLDVSSGISQVVITDKSILNSENFLEIEKKYLSKIYE